MAQYVLCNDKTEDMYDADSVDKAKTIARMLLLRYGNRYTYTLFKERKAVGTFLTSKDMFGNIASYYITDKKEYIYEPYKFEWMTPTKYYESMQKYR